MVEKVKEKKLRNGGKSERESEPARKREKRDEKKENFICWLNFHHQLNHSMTTFYAINTYY